MKAEKPTFINPECLKCENYGRCKGKSDLKPCICYIEKGVKDDK